MNNVTFGDGDSGYYETVAGGAGAVSIFKSLYFFLISLKAGLQFRAKRAKDF